MANLILAFNVVLPLFLCIVLGYFLRAIGMIKEITQKDLNRLCFKVFLPIYLFNSIYTTDLAVAFDGRLVIFAVCGVVGLFLLLMLLIPRIEKENPRRGVMVQAIFRSNFVLYGLPVATSICGEAHIGPTSLLISIVVPIYNVLAVVCLEWFRGGKPDGKKILRGIVTNPLIIASILGVAANLLKLPLPSGVQKCVTDLGRVATPLSLVALGADFKFNKVHGIRKQLILSVAGKLVMAPLVMVTLGILLGFRGDYLVPVLIMFGAPTAVSSYTMAQQMEGDGTLAASVVVFTTAFSILTIFLWVFFLKQLMFI